MTLFGKRKTSTLFLITGLTTFLTGCGGVPNTPSVADGRKALEAQMSRQIQAGAAKIADFRKTNGTLGAGEREYKMDWEADIECVQTTQVPLNPLFTKTCPAGARMTLPGITNFDKTENGWIARRM